MSDLHPKIPDALRQENLETGRVYKFHARNFFYGVYDGNGGFIGIREKFDSLYLFTEYHWDPPWGGTVVPTDATEYRVPEGIEVREFFAARCRQCEQLTEFVPDVPGTRVPGRQHHVDRALDDDHDPHSQTYLPTNRALFDFLVPLEEDEERRAYLLASPEEREVLREAMRAKKGFDS